MPPPVVTAVPVPAVPKLKRPTPAGIQTNGAPASQSSPSPSISAKLPPAATAKQPQTSSSAATSTTPIAPPVNGVSASATSTRPPAPRARRDTGNQPKKTSTAVPRSAGLTRDPAMPCIFEPRPKKLTQDYILRKYTGHPPSLVVHLHATYFRFDAQESTFPYKSPMGAFLHHVRNATVPHGYLLELLTDNGVPFYEGCLIVQVHNHKLPVALAKDEARPSSKAGSSIPFSIHNHSDYITHSPWVPFPKREAADGSKPRNAPDTNKPAVTSQNGEDKENPIPSAMTAGDSKGKEPPKATVTTKVLFPTPESLQTDISIKAITPRGAADSKAGSDTSAMPPPTPMSAAPPTPATSMPPPAKRQKRQKMELSGDELHAFEGQILVATLEPLNLEVPKNRDEAITWINQISDPRHSDPPPNPKTRKRTVAEKAADKALAEEEEKYMLTGDERLTSTGGAGQNSSGDADGSGASAPQFEARFERLNTLTLIKKEHAEKKQQERERQAENERKINLQKQQQAQAAQEQAEQLKQQQQAEQARRDDATRKSQAAAQALRDQQRRMLAAQAQAQAAQAASPHSPPNPQVNNMPQPAHGHPAQNGGMAGGQPSGQAQRFAQAVSQPAVSSPIVRQHTPQNMSSPMVGNVPMSQTNSGMGGSPARPPSIVQTQPPMSAAMAISMSARGSQQSHPSGTPRMPNATPQITHGTPINRPMATPRMTQASPPPGMMVTNSPMNSNMMMGHPNNMGQPGHNPMMAAQIAAQQHQQQQMQQCMMMQQQAQMRMNAQAQQMSPQMQQQMLQQQVARQMQAMQMQNGGMMTPQQHQQHQQQQQFLQHYQATLQQQTAHMQGQVPGQPHPGNPNFANMNGMNMGIQQPMQQAQPTQAQLQQYQQQLRLRAMRQQQAQAQGGNMPQMLQHLPPQIQQQIVARSNQLVQSNIGTVAEPFGGEGNLPQDAMDKLKQQCIAKAHQEFMRRHQQQRMMQQQQAQQQAQQH
ncbi:Spt20 family-domain-containing protein [Xylariaceae sp. FL1019]|nr:Spt20 family-domain-containing protein [Xylariaceae sp. FL1019]